MISDDERREVATRLREWLAIPWYERPWSSDAMQSLGKMVGAVPGEDIVERVTDLIDRPMCNRLKNDRSYWRCSNCGAFVRWDAVTDLTGVRPSSYCPNCGATVTD